MESALDFQLDRLAAAKRAGAEELLRLNTKECAELFNEGTIYYYRFIHFFRAKEWARAERDTARILRLIEFVRRYGEHEDDRIQLDPWRAEVMRIHAAARAMVLLRRVQYDEALETVREGIIDCADPVQERAVARREPKEMLAAVFNAVRVSLTKVPTIQPREESLFVRHGEYWTIQHQGEIASCLEAHMRRCSFGRSRSRT